MAHVTMAAGAQFDILSPTEHKKQTDRIVQILNRSQRPPNSIDAKTEKVTTAGGAIVTHDLFHVPVGMVAVLHRVHIEIEGITAASPSTSGYLNFAIDDYVNPMQIFANAPFKDTTIGPSTYSESVSSGKVAKGGQRFIVYGASLLTSTTYFFNCQLLLWETEG